MSGSSSNKSPAGTPTKPPAKMPKAQPAAKEGVDDKISSDNPKTHVPTMFNMVLEALRASKGGKGLTLQAIKRSVTEAYPSTKTKFSNARLGKAIIKGIEGGEIIRPKASEDTGLRGHFLFNKGLFAFNEKKKLAKSKEKSDKKPAKSPKKPLEAKSQSKPSVTKSPSKPSVSKSPKPKVENPLPEKVKKPRAPKAIKKADSDQSAKKKTPTKPIKRKVPAAQAHSTPKIHTAMAKQKVASVKKAIKQVTGAKTKAARSKAPKDSSIPKE